MEDKQAGEDLGGEVVGVEFKRWVCLMARARLTWQIHLVQLTLAEVMSD